MTRTKTGRVFIHKTKQCNKKQLCAIMSDEKRQRIVGNAVPE